MLDNDNNNNIISHIIDNVHIGDLFIENSYKENGYYIMRYVIKIDNPKESTLNNYPEYLYIHTNAYYFEKENGKPIFKIKQFSKHPFHIMYSVFFTNHITEQQCIHIKGNSNAKRI